MVAANENGEVTTFPVAENIHTNHILDYSIVPARISSELQNQAEALAKEIAKKMNLVGLLGVELFILKNGTLAVNELAPRPHNSGHYTIDACVTSQFEQFVRAVCGLPGINKTVPTDHHGQYARRCLGRSAAELWGYPRGL